MRKIVASLGTSLDGVIAEPWNWPVKDNTDEMDKEFWSLIDSSDAILMGRTTYEQFAEYWSHEEGIRTEQVKRIPLMNKIRKYVVSTSLRTAEWSNTSVISGNVFEEITKLKRESGKDIVIPASATLVEWLLNQGLLDELHLFTFPIVLGNGKRLFKEGSGPLVLRLLSANTLPSDIVHLVYGRLPDSGK